MAVYLRDFSEANKQKLLKDLAFNIGHLDEERAEVFVFNREVPPKYGYILNPAILVDALREIGYEKGEQYDNGWEHDTWIPFDNHSFLPPVTLYYCGYTFDLTISLTED